MPPALVTKSCASICLDAIVHTAFRLLRRARDADSLRRPGSRGAAPRCEPAGSAPLTISRPDALILLRQARPRRDRIEPAAIACIELGLNITTRSSDMASLSANEVYLL